MEFGCIQFNEIFIQLEKPGPKLFFLSEIENMEFGCIQFNEIFIQLEKPTQRMQMAYITIYIGEIWDVTPPDGGRQARLGSGK